MSEKLYRIQEAARCSTGRCLSREKEASEWDRELNSESSSGRTKAALGCRQGPIANCRRWSCSAYRDPYRSTAPPNSCRESRNRESILEALGSGGVHCFIFCDGNSRLLGDSQHHLVPVAPHIPHLDFQASTRHQEKPSNQPRLQFRKDTRPNTTMRGQGEWNHVKRKGGRLRNIPAPTNNAADSLSDGIRPNPNPELSVDDLWQHHDKVIKDPQASEWWEQVRQVLESASSNPNCQTINKAVCLGPGPYEPVNGSSVARQTAHLQTAVFCFIVDHLSWSPRPGECHASVGNGLRAAAL